MKYSIEEIWTRIKKLEGQKFITKRGISFVYEISGNIFRPGHVNQNIPKTDFEKALELVPIDGPGVISDLVRGSAYIWAVLHDQRVSQGDW